MHGAEMAKVRGFSNIYLALAMQYVAFYVLLNALVAHKKIKNF